MGQLIHELKRRNVIRVAIAYAIATWVLIQVADTVFPILGLPEWSVTLVTALLFIGFPMALILSWAFEITPEGIKLEKHVVRDESITHITGRKLDFVIIAMLVVALGYFSYDKFVIDPTRDAEMLQSAAETGSVTRADLSIAVLPFTDLSPAGDQEYFSDGISEEILNVLAHVPGLHVISRSSSFSFKGRAVDIPTVAEQLGVANVLEGSVRTSGNHIRITAQLIDAKTDTHIWSETYDREITDVFAVQDEIAAAVVGTLKEILGLQVAVPPRVTSSPNSEAHDAYLRGRYLIVQRTRAAVAVAGAVREFEQAVQLDPDYAAAHAELALAILLSRRVNYGDLGNAEARDLAAPHVDRAMDLGPTFAQSHAAKGFFLWSALDEGAGRDEEEALSHFRQAVQINPNYSIVYTWMANLLGGLGRYEESFSAQETALRLDPLSLPAMNNLFYKLISRNRLDDAERMLEKFVSLDPVRYARRRGYLESVGGKWASVVIGELDALLIDSESVSTRNSLAWDFAYIGLRNEALAISQSVRPEVMRILGDPEGAISLAELRLAEDPTRLYNRRDLGQALAAAGNFNRARPILEEMWQLSKGHVRRYGATSNVFSANSAAALIAMRRDADDGASVAELLQALMEHAHLARQAGISRPNRSNSVDYEEGLAAYLSGEHERGLELIANAAEDGYFIRPNEAYLRALYDDPDFAPILRNQEARQARERQKVLDLVCTDNPYAAVWQPAEGTCEKFSASGGIQARSVVNPVASRAPSEQASLD